ncbi:hypothetical protein GCM10010112_15990 [Actinoplanes lobatus]|uniref:AB hydrolase-1 domain-containing protein n=1 Tax=Actinoplanes lobatus TaxID=113568 RepID=A0ABQ4AAD0_9ACTN|nr:hypothetical protein GCM10010112_15990 [Actinoplanes lobatus]GIE37961.1 hypothetical protein Alo02nite_08590 [Actinoplanes lobatus]
MGAGAFPLILTHGWPGSVLEWAGMAPLLTGEFDVVIPSLPGYGFSGKPATAGWGVERIAAAWAQIMAGLGCQRYGAAGTGAGTSPPWSCPACWPPACGRSSARWRDGVRRRPGAPGWAGR